MKTFEEIRNEYAVENGYSSWEDLYQKSFIFTHRVDDVMKKYALEVIKEDRINLSRIAKAGYYDTVQVDGSEDVTPFVFTKSIIDAPYPELK